MTFNPMNFISNLYYMGVGMACILIVIAVIIACVIVLQKAGDKLAEKICNLRVFEDENGKMNLNLEQVGGELLVVSQFTLYADTSSRRPGFSGAAKPDLAIPLYERFMDKCRERGFRVAHGQFGADMKVSSVNDGPVTILYDTEH